MVQTRKDDDILPVDEDMLVNLINTEINLVEYDHSELAAQREEATRAFSHLPTAETQPTTGMSSVIFNFTTPAVETLSTYLTKVFCSDKETVIFNPVKPSMIPAAEQTTKMVNAVLHKYNPGYTILSQMFKDAGINKNSVVKTTWVEEDVVYEEEYENITEDELDLILMQKEEAGFTCEIVNKLDVTSVTMDEEGTEVASGGSVTIRCSRQEGKIKIDNIPPEEFLINEGATSINNCHRTRFVAHRTLMHRGDIKKMFPDVDTSTLVSGTQGDLEFSYETISRHLNDATYNLNENVDNGAQATQPIELVESWIKADVDGDGIAEWRHCFTVGNDLLEDEPWYGPLPFASFCYFPLPHKFYGLSVWDKLRNYEKTATAMMRAEIDMRVQQNTFRVIADPRHIDDQSLRSGRPGLIPARPGFDPKMVMPVPTQGGASNTAQILQDLRMQALAEIGIDTVSGQVSKDIEASGNDADKTAMVIDNASAKIERYCREFADNTLRDVIWTITQLLVEHKDSYFVAELLESVEDAPMMPQMSPNGAPMPTPAPTFLLGQGGVENVLNKADLTAKVGLGHMTGQQKIASAQSLIQTLQMLAQDPVSPLPIPPLAKLNLAYEMAKGWGHENPEKLLGTPQEVQALAQQNAQMKQLQMQQMQAQMQGQQAQLQMQQQQVQHSMALADREQQFKEQLETAQHEADLKMKAAQAQKLLSDAGKSDAQTQQIPMGQALDEFVAEDNSMYREDQLDTQYAIAEMQARRSQNG